MSDTMGLLDKLIAFKCIDKKSVFKDVLAEIAKNHLDVKINDFEFDRFGDPIVLEIDSNQDNHEQYKEQLELANAIVFNLYEYYVDKQMITLFKSVKNEIESAINEVSNKNTVAITYAHLKGALIDNFILTKDLTKLRIAIDTFNIDKLLRGANNE